MSNTNISINKNKNKKENNLIVYVTSYGKKFHRKNCYGANIPINLENALKTYDPCGKCLPPTKLQKENNNNNYDNDNDNDNNYSNSNYNDNSTRNNTIFYSDQSNIEKINEISNSQISLISFLDKSTSISTSSREPIPIPVTEKNYNNKNNNNSSTIEDKNLMKNIIDLIKNMDEKITNFSNDIIINKEKNKSLEEKITLVEKKMENLEKKLKEKDIEIKETNEKTNEDIDKINKSINDLKEKIQNLEEKNINLSFELEKKNEKNEKIDKLEKIFTLQYDISKQNKYKLNYISNYIIILNKKIEDEIFNKIFFIKNSSLISNNNFTPFSSSLNFEINFLEKFNNETENLKINLRKKEEEINESLNFIKFNLSEKIIGKILRRISTKKIYKRRNLFDYDIDNDNNNDIDNKKFNKNFYGNFFKSFIYTNGRKKYY
jgi:hypothetical protein